MKMSSRWTNATSRICGAIVLLALPALALATISFERRWHWFREDVGRSVALTADGGYLVGGQTWIDTTQYGIVLARTDSLGDTTSVRHLLDVGNGSGYLCQLSGGDFVAAGVRNGSHVFARGFTPSGDSAWSYDQSLGGQVRALLATSDGGCLVAGRDSMQDMGLIKLDSAGHEEWDRGYDDPRVQGSTAFGAAETRDSGFILCGDVTDYTESYVRLVRTNSEGDTLWTIHSSGPVGPSLRAVLEMPDGGFLAVGSEYDTVQSQQALYLMRTDTNGVIVWTRHISPPGAGTQAMAMRETRDGGYIIAGSIDWGDSARIWLVKLDSGADTVWTSVVGGRGREQAVDVWQTADGGYVIAGTSDPPTDSILLVKTDSLGFAPYGVAEQRPVFPEHIALAVQPNPSGGVARISYALPGNVQPTLRVCDVTGRQVYSSFGLTHSEFQLDLRSTPAGVYLLRLESSRGSATRKLVIE
jgi:hypothetical protein